MAAQEIFKWSDLNIGGSFSAFNGTRYKSWKGWPEVNHVLSNEGGSFGGGELAGQGFWWVIGGVLRQAQDERNLHQSVLSMGKPIYPLMVSPSNLGLAEC